MKKAIEIVAGEETFTNLSKFSSVEDLNETIRRYRDIIKLAVKRSDVQGRLIALLEVLKRHSCKQIGVSYMCKNTIAGKLELSYKTIQRLMAKLESLGLIKQLPMKRKSDMQQTANAIVIIPFLKNTEVSGKQPAEMAEKCPTNKTTNISLKQNIKNNKERNTINSIKVDRVEPKEDVLDEELDYTYVSSSVPSIFVNSISPFFRKANEVYKVWSKVQLAFKKSLLEPKDHIEDIVKTFKEAIFHTKNKRNKKDVYGYLYGAFRNKASLIARQNNASAVVNWLED